MCMLTLTEMEYTNWISTSSPNVGEPPLKKQRIDIEYFKRLIDRKNKSIAQKVKSVSCLESICFNPQINTHNQS